MSWHPTRRSWSSGAVGFCLTLFLALSLGGISAQDGPTASGAAPNPAPYPAGFDPLLDLPTPASAASSDQAATAEALREQVARDGTVRVRVELRVPAVTTTRLSVAQRGIWLSDLDQAAQGLLVELPAGTAEAEPRAADASSLTLSVNAAGLEQLLVSPSAAAVTAASNPNMQRLAAGQYHSLGLKRDGSLWVWGANNRGQLGDGTTANRKFPVQIMTGVKAVAAGLEHSLALKTDGTLWAWGENCYGQLGNGKKDYQAPAYFDCVYGYAGTPSSTNNPNPVQILSDVVAIAAGEFHSLALKTDGTLWAWGLNDNGQLGDKTTTMHLTPVQVLTGVAAIAAGERHSLAIKTAGGLWAWGKNANGQIGDGTTYNRTTPVSILAGAGSTAAGFAHSLALKTDGSLRAWGLNTSGQLGDGTTTESRLPIQVLTGVTDVAAGWYHTLAIQTGGSLSAWGSNGNGRLGDGTTENRPSPVQIFAEGVTAMAGGGAHSLALKTDGTLWAWGRNSEGQLGDQTNTERRSPVQAPGFELDPPAAPSNLAATPASATRITLAWTDNSATEEYFTIERKIGTDGAWTQLDLTDANVATYTDSGLIPGETYTYRVFATNNGGYSADSNEASASPSEVVPPAPPTNLTATPLAATRVSLSWTDSSSDETGFKIERKTGAGGTWKQIAIVAADVTTYTSTGLTGGQTYDYRVRATNANGDSPYSNEATATTPTLPAVPTGLTATAMSDTAVDLAWTDNSTDETSFRIERKTGAADTWAQIATVKANVSTYSNTGLTAGLTYVYRVRSASAAGNSAYSNEATVTIQTPPAAPTDLLAAAVSGTRVDLSWTDNSPDETGFTIERETSAAGTWAPLATVAADVSAHTDTGLTRGQTYVYRVRAGNASGESGYSNEFTVTMPTQPAAPTGLTANPTSASRASLSWTDNSTNETRFRIERKLPTETTWSQIATVSANVVTYNNGGLTGGQSYDYRVRAYNIAGNSAYSNVARVTTPLPSIPDFVVTSITLSPESPTVNGTFSATVRVTNKGGASGDGGWLDVWMNQTSTPVCGSEGNLYEAVGSLAAGASTDLTFSGLKMRSGGIFTFGAFVDSYCQTSEANDGNNQLTKAYTVN